MKNVLLKPIVFFDIESTGTDPIKDRIIEIALIKMDQYFDTTKLNILMNPSLRIPEAAVNIHGIKNHQVEGLRTFEFFAADILDFIGDSNLGGYKSNQFDIPLLFCEFNRVGINWDISEKEKIDIGNIYTRLNPRTLSAAYKDYFGEELDGAHGAMTDTEATVDIFKAMMQDGLKNSEGEAIEDASQLALYSSYDKKSLDVGGKFAYDEDGDVIFNFGKKYKGEIVDPKNRDHVSFLNWMLSQDFLPDAKDIARSFVK